MPRSRWHATVRPKRKNFNLETWMNDLPGDLRTRPICKLVIPGSRHSMTYNINQKSGIAGDFPCTTRSALVRALLGTIVAKRILARWSKLQKVSIMSQLYMGIRYFDIRVQYDVSSGVISSVHLLKSDLLSVGLAQVKDFLISHPKEIVILDFQHFVDFPEPESHSALIDLLYGTFRDRLCPSDHKKLSLDAMHQKGFQVIVVYRDFETHTKCFRGAFFPIVYSRTERSSVLLQSAISHLSIPWPDKWFVIIHMVLQPCGLQLFKRLYGDAKLYAKAALHQTRNYVEHLRSSNVRPAIIVADDVHINDAEFPKLVINLNYSERTSPSEREILVAPGPSKKTKPARMDSSSDEDLDKRRSSL